MIYKTKKSIFLNNSLVLPKSLRDQKNKSYRELNSCPPLKTRPFPPSTDGSASPAIAVLQRHWQQNLWPFHTLPEKESESLRLGLSQIFGPEKKKKVKLVREKVLPPSQKMRGFIPNQTNSIVWYCHTRLVRLLYPETVMQFIAKNLFLPAR